LDVECNLTYTGIVRSTSFALINTEEEPNGMLDLTSLLVTGRVSECLADFLGSGEQMSERVTFHLRLRKLDLTEGTGHSKMGVYHD
jgi:hypothetical protein